jgi:DNA-binding response OmpR family regulator
VIKSKTQVILLVEDDPNDKLFFERALRDDEPHINLQIVSDGEQAISYLKGDPPYDNREKHPLPQLMILDLKLPRRSGHEVLGWIKGQSNVKTLPVVIFSSSDQLSDIEQAYELGANSYLVKPVGYENLTDTIQTIRKYWVENNLFPSYISQINN